MSSKNEISDQEVYLE